MSFFFHLLASEGGSVLSDLAFGEIITFTPDQASAQQGLNSVVMPKLWYDEEEGKTHLVYQSISTEAGRLNIITYDERFGLSKPIGMRGRAGVGFDVHHRPAITKHNNHLYLAVEKDHNSDPIGIVKNRTVGDDLIWILSATTIGAVPTYPNLFEKDGVLVNICQFGDVLVGYNKNSSGDFEGAWTVEAQTGTRDLGIGEDEHYAASPLNGSVLSGRIAFLIIGRNDALPGFWFRKYLIKAQVLAGGITYYNWDESFSKTSLLTAAEMSANFLYHNTGSDVAQGYIPVPALDSDGNFYDISGDGTGGYEFVYQLDGQADPIIKAITLPGSPTIQDGADIGGDGQNGGCMLLLPISPSKIYAVFRIDSGGFGRAWLYKTTNLGDTWTDEGDIYPSINDDIFGVSIPANISSIANNKNFVFAATSNPNPTYAALYFRKAAFGAVQSETGDPFNVTAFTETEYDDLMKLSIYAEAGKIANTGTAVTGVTDQSPDARVVTVVGSPTLDNGTTPTYMTFDGVNDALSVNITGLTTLSEGTIFVVAKGRVGVNSVFMAASRNAVTDQFIQISKSIGGKIRYNDSSVATVDGTTDVSDAFHIFALTFQNGVGSSVLHWLDGELQTRSPVVRSITEGGFFNTLNGLTHVELGRLVRTTTTWYQYDLKHAAICSSPMTFNQMMKAVKYLGTKYNITLNNYFQ